jgi:hypothetical protein
MADSAEDRGRDVAGPAPGRWASCRRYLSPRRVRITLRALPRLILLFVIVWAFTGPVDRLPVIVGAAGLAPAAPSEVALRAAPVSQATGFAVADGPIGTYFVARGGVRTFGPPASNEFMLLGSRTQIFRDHVLKVESSGAVSTVNLFALGAIPFRNVGGRIIPEVDQGLLAGSPVPGSPDYAARVDAFIKANAPDQWEGLPVGFYKAFLGTVKAEDAFPNGGELALLPGFSHEVWGLPISRPTRDAQNPDVILLRWERGVMAWSRQTGAVSAIPLGETFKQVLTGEGLGPERTAAAAGSQFFQQLKSGSPGSVARPSDLPNTVLATAFSQGAPAISAAQYADQATATSTPIPAAPVNPVNPPPPPPPPPPPAAPPAGAAGLPPPPPAGIAAAAPPAPGANAAALPAASPSAGDPCYGDEQITFSPETPRVNNELLIAVTSSRPHPFGRLAGTEKTTFVRERPGQLGYVWEWTVALSYPSKHQYTFFTDSTIECKKIEITVREALSTRTPTPTKTATPWGWDNGNNNNSNNSNNNNSNNSNDNTAIATRINPATYLTGADTYNCLNFESQFNAQHVLRADPTDPNRLDAEDFAEDGIACSTWDYGVYRDDDDITPVTRNFGGGGGFFPTSTPFPSLVLPNDYVTQGDRFNCVDFFSQADAQSVLRYGFQIGVGDPNKLDTGSPQNPNVPDGVACSSSYEAPEWAASFYYPEPHDKTPVARPGVAPTNTPIPPATATWTPSPVPTATPSPTRVPTFPNDYVTQGDRYNCVDFASQADAQAVLRYGSQTGVGDPNRLDTHNPTSGDTPDGIACNTQWEAPEWAQSFYYPEPHDRVPVPTPVPVRSRTGSLFRPSTSGQTAPGPIPTPGQSR